MRYEELVQFLSELPKTNFFHDAEVAKQYRQHVKDFNVTQDLLEKLNDEYKYIFTMSSDYKNIPRPPQRPFKHYIAANGKFVAIFFPQ